MLFGGGSRKVLFRTSRRDVFANYLNIRNQSSFTLTNSQILQQKQQVKQSKTENASSNSENDKGSCESVNDGVQGSTKLASDKPVSYHKKMGKTLSDESVFSGDNTKLDYSWLPKVPSTENLNHREIRTSALYSGYRPIYINSKGSGKNKLSGTMKNGVNSTFYEIAMKLENPSPWMSSATGMELYSEWDHVPLDVLKDLKPFHPPEETNSDPSNSDLESMNKLKNEVLAKERNKLINRTKGRKKPITRLLQLMKQFKKNND
ncbi:hypothetical protein Kpol_1013p9 [Vanderwaltozyma polyspora DSM 70294]|uniref:Protein PET20, mitochondrial n=1 Tax=Vanderwaltozyma polyspora (strain ATCC 22028 / DSM 70294 / BCRC 21397 / CBS 2163 / NBRC 10782 / NRRL Y-8283 / UCD 57-17) TaxID=436907 RepID=A7TH57_VANPO|nr:uncharacterized protein Kpol_1013p9 [Vanderwaltozyma polyspora DSM 70294]EDO18338.1 hypothetical protein Kpol_1013p9 [Vanderwaltozyma polyspora DSM 70294]